MVVCENLVKIYKTKDIEVVALQGLDLNVEDGELMAIIGSSGSGKSTLLNMLGGLDRPSAGTLLVDGKNLLKLTDKELIKYKRETVGFIWQNNARNLVNYLTALENVELPMYLTGKRKRERAVELLEMVGLSHRKNNKLYELSGGEQQRVAIAIALSNSPSFLLADEPTGALDTRTSSQVLDVFRDINKNLGVTVIIVTHDMELSKKVNRVVAIRDGRTSSEFLIKSSYLDEFNSLSSEELNKETIQKEDTHEELIVMDQNGRLQIPKEYLEALGLKGKNKVKVELVDNQIVVHSK
ncbi:ATP-binding cassette domain-containing protein [Clostridium sp. YIM B02515]|uniref:ATP-binding cassette domain-containing protein n=1 Tax=Clostridium rhizosphaerae TaxID=2803861 RepID=A0ABS1TBN0_9CLOT|nr:ATP-binding cassette domain-containing protein [Clostridium rhizosphaerae]MBL4936768.1 ATP-binding cassette domain-containing protein [Clostridium rhizosphaerae]